MSKKSFSKGYGFERTVAKQLSLWVSNGKDGFVFNRRQGSGGSARDKQGHSGASGDLFAEKRIGEPLMSKVSFELKFYAELNPDLWNFIAGKKSKLDGFISQAEESAKPYDRNFALVFKTNRKQPLVLTNRKSFIPEKETHVIRLGEKEYRLFTLQKLLDSKYSKKAFDRK